jgi:HAD superfamily hydrolase (TIGR01549 family)
MNIRAVIFDLDNTLYHYDPCNDMALRMTYMELAKSVFTHYENFHEVHDKVRANLAAELKNQASSHNRVLFFKHIVEELVPNPSISMTLDLFRSYWLAFYEHMKLQPDAMDVLNALKGKYKLALLSNHTTAVQLEKVVRLKLDTIFDHIVTSEEVGVEKPDPKIYEFTLRKIGVSADQAVMIGDQPAGDIIGAKQAGLMTIHTTEFCKESSPPEADHSISQLRQVLDILPS